jgi:epoxyqueuosine reductase QueG
MEAAAERLRETIVSLARQSLVDEVRFTDAENLPESLLGFDGGRFSGRQPRDMMPKAETVILFGTYIGAFYMEHKAGAYRTTRLTLSGFYNNVVKPLAPIAGFLASEGYASHIVDTGTDDVSVPLKPLAVKAGLGWVGKNSLLLNKKYGSFLALGAILTNAKLAETYPYYGNFCKGCTRCREACPTGALERPYDLERNFCLSNFLESATPEEETLYRRFESADAQGYFFECDICQNACPHNRRHLAQPLDTPFGRTFTQKRRLEEIMAADSLKSMGEAEYERLIKPVLAGFDLPYELFARNVRLFG